MEIYDFYAWLIYHYLEIHPYCSTCKYFIFLLLNKNTIGRIDHNLSIDALINIQAIFFHSFFFFFGGPYKAIFILWLLLIVLLRTCVHMYLFECMFLILLGTYL